MSSYRHLEEDSYAELRIKGSKFLSYASYVEDQAFAKMHLANIRELHPKATHHCSGYSVGVLNARIEYSSDDGEPSGTAGRPILSMIKSHQLRYVSVIVVRYYGGTKLGSSGLIKAYKESADLVLSEAKIAERDILELYELSFSYDVMPAIIQWIDRRSIVLSHKSFEEKASLGLLLKPEESDAKLLELYCLVHGSYESEIDSARLSSWKAELFKSIR